MKHEAKIERLRIGLRGLALLREWPFGDPARADEQLQAMTESLAHRDEPPMNEALDVTALDHAEGYAAWSETYDDPGNALLLVEEPILRSLLGDLPAGDAVDVACGTGRVTAIAVRTRSPGDGDRSIGGDARTGARQGSSRRRS